MNVYPSPAEVAVLAFLDAAITSRPTIANVTALGTSTRLGSIKGIDRGSVNVAIGESSDTATIGAVTLARSVISNLGTDLGYSGTVGGVGYVWRRTGRVELTNTTTVTVACSAGNAITASAVGFQVVEYNS